MRKLWLGAKVCCVICASGIGDAIMATPLLEVIKRSRPEARLIVVGTRTTKQVFEGNPNVDAIIECSFKPGAIIPFFLFLWRLRQEHIDVLFGAQPSGTIRHSLIAACSGARVLLRHASYNYGKFSERDYSFVYTDLLPDKMERHRVELNLDYLRFMGEDIQEKSVYPRYNVSKTAQEKIERVLISAGKNEHSNKLIVVHPGAGRQDKRWMPERFAVVCRALIVKGFVVCLVGGSDERNLCDDIAQRIGTGNILNVAGTLSLGETAALLKKSRCVIANDSGIMHLSTAVGKPVIAIFGPTDFRHIGPFSLYARIVCRSDNIKDIMPSHVLSAVSKELHTD